MLGRLLQDIESVGASEEHGYFVAVKTLEEVAEGKVRSGTGSVVFSVNFKCIVFRLVKNEVVEAEVTEFMSTGIFACSTMEVAYFKTNTPALGVEICCTPDGRIDFSALGQEFGLDPASIKLNGIRFPVKGLISRATWAEIKNAFTRRVRPDGTQDKPVIVTGTAPVLAGGERPPKRSKPSGIGFSESVDKVKKEWKSKYSKFLAKCKENRCELSTENGVPLDHLGRPSILLDQLTAGWTKDVPSLWERATNASSEVVPVIGVSGSGKTRFLYELLAEKWVFFWTARTKGNGGSEDFALITEHRRVDNKATNYSNATDMMRCAILARLLILGIFLDEIPDLEPLQWLMLQVQFRVFSCENVRTGDVYLGLTKALVDTVLEDSDGLDRMIHELWMELERKLECNFIVVLDEAQGLGSIGVDCYKSPESGNLKSIFSPLVKALQKPSTSFARRSVFVAGTTSVSFLKLEEDIVSVIGKSTIQGAVRFASIPFSSWKDVTEVLKFCKSYLKLEVGQEEDNARYLLRKFRGRRRCLVSCVEELLQLNKGLWSEKVVDDYFKEITSSNSSNSKDITSIYYAVKALCGSKGLFSLGNKEYDARTLVRRLALLVAFGVGGEFLVSTKENMTLLEAGLGQLKHSSGSQCTFSIYEPTVHRSILNYVESTISLEVLLKDQMVDCMHDPSAVGRQWETLFTIYVAKLFDGTKLLADMCCFKGAEMPQNFAIDKPMITGDLVGVWRESYKNNTVSAFLDAEEKDRQQCLIFDDRSGPDVLFVVRLGDLRIPVFCQLKLRRQVNWGSAEATTNPPSMYRDSKYATFRSRVLDACKDGCISLVVCYPAKKPAKRESETHNRLLGYVGQTEAEVLFGPQLCDFLSSVKGIEKQSS